MVHGLGKWTCTPGGGDWRGGEYHLYNHTYHYYKLIYHYYTHIYPIIALYAETYCLHE